MKLEIVTTEEIVFSEEVDIVVAPGSEGQLGILPGHAPLITSIKSGDVLTRRGAEEKVSKVSGGFLEVAGDNVRILADS
ncbi:MAG: ATP synthase F1 subunit epsilon [Chloroflexi bacterium]|nr:ATP synthase F1 subunit epsilon [Chloroflexota bacterium]|tara:strand:+ start:473 stop:709 length:237 start_codon:yes stop_codon:yes gene_type:complete